MLEVVEVMKLKFSMVKICSNLVLRLEIFLEHASQLTLAIAETCLLLEEVMELLEYSMLSMRQFEYQ